MNALVLLKSKLTLILLCILTVPYQSALAKSDKQIMGDVQKAREMARHGGVHTKHLEPVDPGQIFRGVFYGYLPCKDCAGIKMTLSLKNKNNYLLVTQHAQASIREFYEKGKYVWDEKSSIVTLTSRKDSSIKKLLIKDEGTLIMLSPEGTRLKGDQDQYSLVRSDKNKSREVHIH